MSFQPEIIPSIGDITRLGVPYARFNAGIAEEVFATFPIADDELKSIYVRVVMASEDSPAFAQFEMSNVFQRVNGDPIELKTQVDKITNRDNPANTFFFRINGNNVEIVCCSGLNEVTRWNGMVAVIGLKAND